MAIDVRKPLLMRDYDGMRVSFLMEPESAEALMRSIENVPELEMTVKKKSKRRSLSANALLWALLGDICGVLNAGGDDITADELYRKYIAELPYYIVADYWETELPTLERIWNGNGIGWFFVKTDVVEDGAEPKYTVRQYYGSSQYDKDQMAVLIDHVMQDAKAIGIDCSSESFRQLLELYPGGQ